jgi:hypothetical protein
MDIKRNYKPFNAKLLRKIIAQDPTFKKQCALTTGAKCVDFLLREFEAWRFFFIEQLEEARFGGI